MTHWFLTLAKNLSWYGIDSTKVMVPAQQARRVVSDKPIDMVRDQIQEELRAQIADLLQKIASERDYFLIQRYEQEVRFADSRRVARDGEEDFSIDAVLNKMREDRSTFKREQHQQVRSQAYNPYGSEHQGYAPSINPHFLPEGTVLMR
jgi:hypothetical protein